MPPFNDRRTYLMNEISDALRAPRDAKGVGSSVHASFLEKILPPLGLRPEDYPNKYRRFEAALLSVGQSYDRRLDSSEHREESGGGTITNAGLEKMLAGIRQRRGR